MNSLQKRVLRKLVEAGLLDMADLIFDALAINKVAPPQRQRQRQRRSKSTQTTSTKA